MTTRPLAPLRRLGAALLAALCLLAPTLVLQAAPGAGLAAGGAAAYDAALGQADCALLGRAFVPGSGCSRTRCVAGAEPWRRTYGAEACALRGGRSGYGFAATVDVRLCTALGRRWIAEVNYCASEPDRSLEVRYDAPQCVAPATVYVPLEEREGYLDECLTPARAAELVQLTVPDHLSLFYEVALRSTVQCPTRPGHVVVDGFCTTDPGFRPAGGGVVVIGDSLTWRGSDELGRIRPTFTLDGVPARPATELAPRLAAYRAAHGRPAGVVIELGTVPAPSFRRQDLARAVASLPRSTRVMLVLPHFELSDHPDVVTPQSTAFDGWMRGLARSRARTCVADWPAYVRGHPGTLQDGVHTTHAAEGRWARWISQQWARC